MDKTTKIAKILLVEDNMINSEVAVEMLEMLLLEIDTASDGRKAVEKVMVNHYDLVFMDYLMPIMNGAAATSEIRKSGKSPEELPIIALTADKGEKEVLMASGMNDILIKPLSLKNSVRMLKKYIHSKATEFEELYNLCKNERSNAESVDGLCNIPGIDSSKAVIHCSSADMAQKAWKDFSQVADFKKEKINSLFANRKINDFRIEVHALKSTSAIIGAEELSSEFEKLELLAKAGDVESIQEELPVVMAEYMDMKNRIIDALDEEPIEQLDVPNNSIISLLDQLINASNEIFLDGVDGCLAELERCILPENMLSEFNKLKYNVFEINFPEAAKIAERMKKML